MQYQITWMMKVWGFDFIHAGCHARRISILVACCLARNKYAELEKIDGSDARGASMFERSHRRTAFWHDMKHFGGGQDLRRSTDTMKANAATLMVWSSWPVELTIGIKINPQRLCAPEGVTCLFISVCNRLVFFIIYKDRHRADVFFFSNKT